MFGQSDQMPSDKMFKLFLIQSISSFVAKDYDSGLHFLNEVKTAYAESFRDTTNPLHPVLKGLAKEIIQSLDMFSPGSSANQFSDVNAPETHAISPQQELQSQFQSTNQNQPQSYAQEPVQQRHQPEYQATEEQRSVSADLQELLRRRRERRSTK